MLSGELLERDVSLPPLEVLLLVTFFALTGGVSILLLAYVLVNTITAGYWTIAAVAAAGIVLAVAILYAGVARSVDAFR